MKLTIELVPQTCFYSNLRLIIPKTQWDILRRKTYLNAKYKCEICNEIGPKHPVECHEIWEYNDIERVQTLTGLIALCPNCHEVKHIGLAQIKGNMVRAIAHFQEVNGITHSQATSAISEAFTTWAQSSKYSWTTDINWIQSKTRI